MKLTNNGMCTENENYKSIPSSHGQYLTFLFNKNYENCAANVQLQCSILIVFYSLHQ